MDGALDAQRSSRRADGPSRKADPTKAPAAKTSERADETAVDDTRRERAAGASSDCAPAEQPEAPREEAKSDDAADQNAGEAIDVPAETVEEAVEASGAFVPAVPDGEDGDSAASQGDSLARGRRWVVPAAEQANEHSETAPNGVAAHGTAGAPGLKLGHAIAREAAQAAAPQADAVAELAQNASTSAPGQSIASTATTDAPVTEAIETAKAAPQAASKAEAAAIVENAMAAVETVAGAEPTGANTTGSDTHEQAPPKPQLPAQAAAGETPVVAGPSDGVRFTVAGAAGNAAYVNAAPRQEEAVLPKIVMSIRLHAVLGTT
jgi:hypothetical protein